MKWRNRLLSVTLVGMAGAVVLVGLAGAIYYYGHHFWSRALADTIEVKIEAEPITNFQVGVKDRTKFGALRFSSGIEYYSDNENIGGISGIRILEGGTRFLSVSDGGVWFTGFIERDSQGKITGISNAKIAPMLDKTGGSLNSKYSGDAEGLEIVGNDVLVSFERDSRIWSYPLDLDNLASRGKDFRPSIRKFNLRSNKGLEAVTVLERSGTDNLNSVKVAAFSEFSVDGKGNIRGFISSGKKWESFTVKAIGEFKVTGATLLPGGDILILERQFSLLGGLAIQMRRISGADIKPGAILDGEILFEADSQYQVDNLEGISAWENQQGQTMLTIISDNNFSLLQRNLMLEFELLPMAD
ncbi:MAG: esterase-like activity of phytase family protein [Rhizobiaceae bacterium]|nr:esterase-like activity of phytase family protein [Rhizobiaceae bacterium]